LKRSSESSTDTSFKEGKINLILKPVASSMKRLIALRIGAILSLILCLFILATEASILAGYGKTLPFLVKNYKLLI
jgi:hypothetical protein